MSDTDTDTAAAAVASTATTQPKMKHDQKLKNAKCDKGNGWNGKNIISCF